MLRYLRALKALGVSGLSLFGASCALAETTTATAVAAERKILWRRIERSLADGGKRVGAEVLGGPKRAKAGGGGKGGGGGGEPRGARPPRPSAAPRGTERTGCST